MPMDGCTEGLPTLVHVAPNEEAAREDARQGGFPVTRIPEVKSVIDRGLSSSGTTVAVNC